jgi:hypothetical protein
MARDAFVHLAGEVYPEDNLSGMMRWLLDKHEEAYQLYTELPPDKKRITVNGQTIELPRSYFLALFFYFKVPDSPYQGSAEVPDDDLYGLQKTLEYASTTANEVFAPMLSAVQFDPSSFATWDWSEKPGAHEMHLKRRQNNPLFTPERQVVTGTDVYAARVQDAKEWDVVLSKAAAIRKELLDKELPPNWQDFLHDFRKRIDELLPRAHRLGSTSNLLVEHLHTSRQFISDVFIDAHQSKPESQKLYREADQLHTQHEATMFGTEWLRQIDNPQQVIPVDEVISAFLCEEVGEIAETIRILALKADAEDCTPATSQMLGQLRTGALELVLPLQAAGTPLPGIAEKLDALGLSL